MDKALVVMIVVFGLIGSTLLIALDKSVEHDKMTRNDLKKDIVVDGGNLIGEEIVNEMPVNEWEKVNEMIVR